MAKRTYWSEEDLRATLRMRLRNRRQLDVATEIGVTPQHLSKVVTGDHLNGKILEWLGFQPSEKLFVRKEKSNEPVN